MTPAILCGTAILVIKRQAASIHGAAGEGDNGSPRCPSMETNSKMEIGNSKLQIPLPEPTGRFLAPLPRGTVIPRYWGDPSRFGGAAKEHWSFKQPKSRRSLRAALVASL